MGDIVEKLRLKELAEEDVYFAKEDLKLIRALHEKKLAKLAQCDGKNKQLAKAFEKRFAEVTDKHEKKSGKLLRCYRDLLDQIKLACKLRH